MKPWIVPALALLALMLFLGIRFVQHMPPKACLDSVGYMQMTRGMDSGAHCDHPAQTMKELPLNGAGYLYACTCKR